ncbi:DUF4422 domain-containing protein [Fructilactobacillus sanfranciscensis]|uniref:Exopolysaccharide biosynthesis protein n=2 Tax=Fructilactobacillus sanfranciscensis TaxID=1625 RepID=A0A5C4THJ3_FRUSA|nr:DUF4422 domain-containing protein [Fructilactobacillus sanfranciscensis]TNK89779.1 exopolysaccharide biosynthesis protein [Fructilactobacillus sanfranciscensis]
MNIKILVATHKDNPMPSDTDLYLPILVGANKNYNGQIGFELDNHGDNISDKNPNYNELTAIYWAWKNLNNVDAVGLFHYRRLFSLGSKRDLNIVLTKKQVEKLLEKAPVILPKKRNYYIETIKTHYTHSHYRKPLEVLRQVLKNDYPKYLSSFDDLMNKRSAHMFNMFIMKTPYFNEYCEFVFSVLSKVEKQIDISNYSVQEARVFGYLSELLMDTWINTKSDLSMDTLTNTNQVTYIECNWIQIGKRKLFKKALVFLKRKFLSNVGKDETHFSS